MSDAGWWETEPGEGYWLEATDRADLGVDLRAPLLDESGRPNWRYQLFKSTRPGDLVFHYHADEEAIVGVSRVAGPPQDRPIVWGARGTFARAKNVQPRERPGYFVPLSHYHRLIRPVTLAELREDKPALRALVAKIQARHPKSALYFPFELAERPVRLLQGYAFKLPRDFVLAYPSLTDGAIYTEPDFNRDSPPKASPSAVGATPPTEPVTGAAPLITRPARGGQGYGLAKAAREAVERRAMDAAWTYFEARGYTVEDVHLARSYDLHATKEGAQLLIEVKGTTSAGDSVTVTKNEVALARQHGGQMVLYVLHSLMLTGDGPETAATGGEERVLWPWDVEAGTLEPLEYRYTLPPDQAS